MWYIDLPDICRREERPLLDLAGTEAARARLPLIVHATELRTAKEALAAGAKVLVHSIESDTVDAELITLAQRYGTILIPTLTVLRGTRMSTGTLTGCSVFAGLRRPRKRSRSWNACCRKLGGVPQSPISRAAFWNDNEQRWRRTSAG